MEIICEFLSQYCFCSNKERPHTVRTRMHGTAKYRNNEMGMLVFILARKVQYRK